MSDVLVGRRSFSQLTSWLRCGYAYKLERIDDVSRVPAWWFVGGSSVHTATEWWDMATEEPLTTSDLDTLWNQAWSEELESEHEKTDLPEDQWRAGGRKTKEKPNKEDGVWWYGEGRVMLDRWIEWRNTYPNWEIATLPDGRRAVEPEFTVMFGDIPVRAYLDRVFNVTTPQGHADDVVVDIKTGSRPPDNALQLGVYACILELAYGPDARPQLGCYWDARKGDITVPEDLSVYTIEMITQMFTQFNLGVMNEIFIPNVGQSCRTCGVARYCPAVGGDLADLVAPKVTHQQEDK